MCSVLKEFQKWVTDSRMKQLDSATEETIKELRREVARRRWKRAINAARLMVRLGKAGPNSSKEFHLKTMQKANNTANVHQKASMVPGELRGSCRWMHDQKAQLLSGLGVEENAVSAMTDRQENALVGQNEIKEIINDALEQPRCFREGSLMSNLIESGIEVVWFGDRHPK